MANQKTVVWSRDRLGLTMIGASLLVIAVAAYLLADNSRDARESLIRAQGISLVRVLSSMSLAELVPASHPTAILKALQFGDNRDHFAYAAIIAADGRPIAEVAASSVIVPEVVVPLQPAAWLGESLFPAGSNRARVIEFHAPLLVDGELAAHLRLGYFEPGFTLSATQMSFVATLALLIFLLTPLFYFLVRHEIRPIIAASSRLGSIVEEDKLGTVEVAATGELGQFIGRFNQFITYSKKRIEELESDNKRVVASTKLLSYRRERILRVLESLPDGILVLDETGTITAANKRVEIVFGVDTDTITGSPSLDWCIQPQLRQFLSDCRLGASGPLLAEPVEFAPDYAEDKTLAIAAYPLFSPENAQPIGTLAIIRDITTEALARHSRGEFVAHVAHELKTPLNVLSMYAETLQETDSLDDEMRVEAANVIYDEVDRLSTLINNMLSITRIEMGSLGIERQRVRLRDMFEDAMSAVSRTRAAADLEFELDVPQELTAQKLDKDLLRVALNNLLTNAVKYNRPGGKVILAAEETPDTIRISIKDTGIGIAEKDVPRIFEKFYRSDEEEVTAQSGHGLGLSLAKDIIELHNGSIHVESKPGIGTEFVIDLWKFNDSIKKVG